MIMIIYCILVILGFIAFYLVPDMGKYSKEGQWDPHIGRFLSTLLDPNYMAGMLLFMITTLLSRILQPLHFSRYIYIILCFISLIALYMTFSRSGYVAFIISFITFLMLYNWRIIAISSIFIVLIMLSNMNIEVSENRSLERMSAMIDTAKGLFLGDISSTDPTSLMRLQSWKDSLELYKEAPIIGIGFNTYRPIATSKGIVPDGYFNSGGSDSSLLNVLITTGFIGFIVFISFIIDMLYTHYRLYKTTYDTRYIAFIAGFIGIIAHSFFVNSLFYPFIMLFIMTLWGQNMSVYKDNNIDT